MTTRIDHIMADLGLGRIDFTDEARAVVTEHVEAFLRGGGSFTWRDYVGMSPEVREIFVEVGDRIRQETAAFGAVAGDPRVAKVILGGGDVGDATTRILTSGLADMLEQAAKGGVR